MRCGSSLEAADRAVADVEGSGDMDQFCSPKLAPCEVVQYLLTQRIRVAFTGFGKGDDLVGDGLLDIVGAIACDPIAWVLLVAGFGAVAWLALSI
jgi:hypothetical protein